MEILRFTLSGKNAFYKKPEVNSYVYFTYGHIHKIALLGMFGSILGYGGYTQMQGYERDRKKQKLQAQESWPDFYARLKHLKISVLPGEKYPRGIIPKKIQVFNNSVGYACGEKGGNLVVKEQWLENPQWEICVLIDCDEAVRLAEALCHRKCVYYPYLGKNDHFATIENARTEEAVKTAFARGKIDCLAPEEAVTEADMDDFDDFDDLEETGHFTGFRYAEALPCEISGWTNHYILKKFIYTDAIVEADGQDVYMLQDKKQILFY